jgi:hypothetical protein
MKKKRKKRSKMRVVGKVRPLMPPGLRIMTCIGCEPARKTKWGLKCYLFWSDEDTGEILEQYFNRGEKEVSLHGKAAEVFMIALNLRAGQFKHVDLRKVVGLKAQVTVETVRPTYRTGALKGKPKPVNFEYSKIGQIVEPMSWDSKLKEQITGEYT